MNELLSYITSIGIEVCVPFRAAILEPEERIRELCRIDRCGNFRKNYMCPPYVGSVDDIRTRLAPYQNGVLLQYQKALDVKNDPEGLRETKLAFHKKVLQTEKHLERKGIKAVWGMIGGDCTLCRTCLARIDEPCPYPNRARTSLESIGVDVMNLLDTLKLDKGFYDDRITWTGCVLF